MIAHAPFHADASGARPTRGNVTSRVGAFLTTVVAALVAAGCGGGGSSSGSPASPPTATALAPSSTLAEKCVSPRAAGTIDPLTYAAFGDVQGTLADEKAWLRSWTDETYLWYRDVEALSPSVLAPGGYATAIAYFDALRSPLTTASGKRKDAFHFTENTDEYAQSSENGIAYGYGWRLTLPSTRPPRSAYIVATTPGLQAQTAGLARGQKILTVDGVDVALDDTASGIEALNAGLFPTAPGPHQFTLVDPLSGTQTALTLNAAAETEMPVPNVTTLPAPNQDVGYLEFDSHIGTSEVALATAITRLQASNVTDLVLDLRYNGGGYLDIADELAYMIAGPTITSGKAFATFVYNDKNPFQVTTANATRLFRDSGEGFSVPTGQPLPTLGLSRVYVLTTADTCSASEAIINGLRGAGVQVMLIGATTCGKPYGFRPSDNCGTTYFTVQFSLVNALGSGDYADGFAPDCAVSDDYGHALGDPAEALLATALGRRNGNGTACVAGGAAARVRAQSGADRPASAGHDLRPPAWRHNMVLSGR